MNDSGCPDRIQWIKPKLFLPKFVDQISKSIPYHDFN